MIMKEWVAAKPPTSNIKFVDFDAMSVSVHAPPICAGENWHYQCFLTWCAPPRHFGPVGVAVLELQSTLYWLRLRARR